MIFNEVYGCYYNTVAKIINKAIDGQLDEKTMIDIINENAFGESIMNIVPAIKNQNWQLIDSDYDTPIINQPTMPLTTLQKRWLKTIMLDPRIALFQIPSHQLDDVEPLFESGDIVYFDRYSDGDPYDNPEYIAQFYRIVQAIKENKQIKIKFYNRFGDVRRGTYLPKYIEYSDNEDKFRMIAAGRTQIRTINIARIISSEIIEEEADYDMPQRAMQNVVFEIYDDRNTLERVLMKFAHQKKQVKKIDKDKYIVEMNYYKDDQPEILIQLLEFGSYIKVIEGESIVEEIKNRVKKQKCKNL